MSYPDWRATAQALKSSATQAVREGRAVSVHDSLLQAQFDRFLSRVFSDGDESEWLLKGGMGILARVPRSRATRDLDLASRENSLGAAIERLTEVAGRDLGDHLTFSLTATKESGLGDNQPGVQTRRAIFDCRDDRGRKIGDVPIDVVVGPPPVGTVEVTTPANLLTLPHPLVQHPYRLFPIADQIADKVCATMSSYQGRPSSRTKDLVDLAVIARTQTVDQDELHRAIEAKQTLSGLSRIHRFSAPAGWAAAFRKLAGSVPVTADLADLHLAEQLVADWLQPALEGPGPRVWVPGYGWTSRVERRDAPQGDGAGQVWVQPHVREGLPVRGHYRSPRS